MKFKQLFIGLVTIGLLVCCSTTNRVTSNKIVTQNDTTILRTDFKKYFDDCNVKGSIVIYDNNKQKFILSDTLESKQETLPASTFKIINLLIALETKTISSEKVIVKWVGSTDTLKYGYRPEIYHDMTVKEAFEVSAGWVFVELAKKIIKSIYDFVIMEILT
jgi:beta-lactamase class D